MFKKINYWVGFISAIITIILFITENKTFRMILYIIVLIYILFIVTYIIFTIFSTDKAKKKIYASFLIKHQNSAEKLHSFYHNLRNYTSSIYSKENIVANDIKEINVNICNYIAEFYRQLFKDYLNNSDVFVCLKTIKPKTIFDSDYMNWEMETIARNISSSESRKKADNKPVKISENTDFQVIISDKYDDELFAFADMRTIQEDFPKAYNNLQYNNSRKDFLQYYKSTIVVPIKIDGSYISKDLKNMIDKPNEKNFILGFLCIDSLKTFTTQEELDIFVIGTEYAKAIGDSLYLFFEKVLLLGLNCNRITYSAKKKSNQYYKRGNKNEKYKNNNN